jgi:hypothetical protein
MQPEMLVELADLVQVVQVVEALLIASATGIDSIGEGAEVAAGRR